MGVGVPAIRPRLRPGARERGARCRVQGAGCTKLGVGGCLVFGLCRGTRPEPLLKESAVAVVPKAQSDSPGETFRMPVRCLQSPSPSSSIGMVDARTTEGPARRRQPTGEKGCCPSRGPAHRSPNEDPVAWPGRGTETLRSAPAGGYETLPYLVIACFAPITPRVNEPVTLARGAGSTGNAA